MEVIRMYAIFFSVYMYLVLGMYAFEFLQYQYT